MNINEVTVTTAINAVNALPCHKMNATQVKEAVSHGVWLLDHETKESCVYLPKTQTGLCCGLLVDYTNKTTTLFLEKLAKDYESRSAAVQSCTGIVLKVSQVITVLTGPCFIDKKGDCFAYEQKYGHVHSSAIRGSSRYYAVGPSRSSLIDSKDEKFLPTSIEIAMLIKRLHDDGIIHGYIAPESFYRLENGNLALTNFFNSRALKGITQVSKAYDASRLAAYILPEAQEVKKGSYSSKDIVLASDTYGFACTLFRVAFGQDLRSKSLDGHKAVSSVFKKRYDAQVEGVYRAFFGLFAALFHSSLEERPQISAFVNHTTPFINYPDRTLRLVSDKKDVTINLK